MKIKKCNRGSLTLEACMVVPMFIVLMLLVNGFFVMFMGQQIMCHALIQSAKSLAFDPYASQRVAENEDDQLAEMFVDIFSFAEGDHVSTEQWYKEDTENLDEVVEERFIAYLKLTKSGTEKVLEQIGIKDGLDGLDFSGCTLEEGILTIKANYTQEFIFNATDLTSFERSISVKVKLFEYKSIGDE